MSYQQLKAKEITKIIEDRFLELKNKNLKAKIHELSVIDSSILLSAPSGYFDVYSFYVEYFTKIIQSKMAQDTNVTALINQTKQDPANRSNREKSTDVVNRYLITEENNTKNFDDVKNNIYNNFSQTDRRILFILICNEIFGFGPIEPLFRDTNIKEIICNGPKDIQVEIKGKIHKVPSCKFNNSTHLLNLINKLYASVNKSITRTTPIERARLSDNSRLFAIDESVAPMGPSLNIRRHTDEWVSPDFLLKNDSASPELMEWLGNMFNAELNVIIAGGTGSGKTTLLSALTGFYRNDARLITIERNIELKGAKNKLWAPALEVIPPNPGTKNPGISMRDLVEASTQMLPHGIILGEITGPEAWDVSQALNSGHFGATTIHANSETDTITRLISLISQADMIKGEELLNQISAAFDLIIMTKRFPQDGSRKITGVYELGSDLIRDEENILRIPIREIWRYEPDVFSGFKEVTRVKGEWKKINDLSDKTKDKHNLQLFKYKTLDELKELYK